MHLKSGVPRESANCPRAVIERLEPRALFSVSTNLAGINLIDGGPQEPPEFPPPAPIDVPADAPDIARLIHKYGVRGGQRFKFKIVYTSDQRIDPAALTPMRTVKFDRFDPREEDAAIRKIKSNRAGTRVAVSYYVDFGRINRNDNGSYNIYRGNTEIGGFAIYTLRR